MKEITKKEKLIITAGTLIEGKNADGHWHLRRLVHRVREAHDDDTYTVETLVSRNFVGKFTYEEIMSKYSVRRTKNELYPSNRSRQYK
jgi:hypothetical protein